MNSLVVLIALLIGSYGIFSIGGHLFFNRVMAQKWFSRRISDRIPTSTDIRRELKLSLGTIGVFFLVGVLILWMSERGWTSLYWKVGERGWLYLLFSWLLVHTLHDCYFYFTHLWMHRSPWLYRFHSLHHKSVAPTPLAALAFHPVEAFIQGLFFLIIAIVLPVHVGVLLSFYFFESYINMWGHTVFEFWIDDLPRRPLWRILNTPTHHYLHHMNPRTNFGIYYNFWDSLMGTNNPDYVQRFDQIKAKAENKIFSRF